MTNVPLGMSAYERSYAGEAIIRVENRFFELNPTSPKTKFALLARCGTNALATFDGGEDGHIRGCFAKEGLFSGDLFVCSGPNLYRYAADGTLTHITGLVNGTGNPTIAWQKGIGYERLFIADGLLLQYYDGGSQATGTLTLAGGAISNQVIEIDGVYYSWNAAVDTGPPDGTSAFPWLANPGTDPLGAMANLLNFNGTRGTDFSTALGGPAVNVTADAPLGRAVGTLTLAGGGIFGQVIRIGDYYYGWNVDVEFGPPTGIIAGAPFIAKLGSTDAESLANMVKLLNYTGVSGVDYSSEIGGASIYVTATSTPTTLVATAVDEGTVGNSVITDVVAGSFLSWSAGTLGGGTNTATTLKITARSDDADGNAITTTVFSGSFLTWTGATLSGGGTHVLSGVPMPDGVGPRALAEVSGYVLVSVADSQKFFWIVPGEVTIDALNFAEKESNPDNILDMNRVGDQVLISGNGSAENWYASGDPGAPFLPIEGRVYQRGVIEGTAVVVNDGVILVGNDGKVYEVGYQYGTTTQAGVQEISNAGICERIRVTLRSEQGLTP